jgi:polygalacturonase
MDCQRRTLRLAWRWRRLRRRAQDNDHGAKGDGTTLETVAIHRTIDAAAAAGGTVSFKPGTYLTGSL